MQFGCYYNQRGTGYRMITRNALLMTYAGPYAKQKEVRNVQNRMVNDYGPGSMTEPGLFCVQVQR